VNVTDLDRSNARRHPHVCDRRTPATSCRAGSR